MLTRWERAGTRSDKYGSKHTGKRTNVQANIGGTYSQMRTNIVYRREQTNGVYIREVNTEKAKIQELYVKMKKHIFGTSLSHKFLKLLHKRVHKTKLL